MQRTHQAFLVLSFVIFGFSIHAEDNFRIDGTLAGEFEGYLYLKYDGKTDSTLVENGAFTFKGNTDYPVSAAILPKNGAFGGTLYFGQENIRVSVTYRDNVIYLDDVEGSAIIDSMESTLSLFEDAMDEGGGPALYDLSKEVITNDPENPFVSELVLELAAEGVFFTTSQVNELIGLMAPSAIDPDYLESVETVLNRMANLKVGDPFPDFEFPSLEGGSMNLTELKGKVVLVDIWDSMCRPCIMAMPKLKALSEKYKDRGLEVVSVSLDTSEDIWKRTNENLVDITWNNLIDRSGFDGEFATGLGVTFIPFYYLIDEDGLIRGINVKGHELENEIVELLD